mmetsp:Transcript_13580/g.29821  ORF Transcript_13580/g.29821 Transcript_13580/m.29821 type:complete len:599 (-) Transcript_13580:185-1981(-)|eukprot:CAMPEP_0168750098 /NCGR_PEP_ID=MMETSP0724-20121128/17077_1 /TAXON_ID=265536 /ORGANISM="Amphiprora sp., Strain CCMP467" /LENGTH=598 /DNA_ID=CAMNT_0008798069 /DNA_START=245 /DNA_END=2041 /DNA_ORIENTATION=-
MTSSAVPSSSSPTPKYGSISIHNHDDDTPATSHSSKSSKASNAGVPLKNVSASLSNGNSNSNSNSNKSINRSHSADKGNDGENDSVSSASTYSNATEPSRRILIKTQSSFLDDLKEMRHGSIPHSTVVALSIGVVCGSAAFVYYAALEYMLDLLWEDLPEILYENVSPSLHWTWIPLLGFFLAAFVGLSVVFLGEPGDLPYTIKCVHEKAYVAMDHVLPMVAASFFSILGGGSLGPEAPLVAICAAIGGFVSRSIFGCTERNVIRKHTLMGMSGALAAFFGCPIGGSLFALEVCSRFGVEYFEHATEAIFCGEVCLAVFRTLARLPIKYIWTLEAGVEHMEAAETIHIAYGVGIGFAGAFVAFLFARFHATVMGWFGRNGLLRGEKAVHRALTGAVVVIGMGILVPQTMFWGEYEFQTVWTMAPASTLEHVWPTTGATGFEMTGFGTAVVVGVTKLIAISFTVAGGYRGGYIFPIFCSGAALGRAIYCLFPFIPVQICTLCMAAAMNVAVTRTYLATTLILSYLAAEQAALSVILAASLTSLFATAYMPFIKSQVERADMDASMFMYFDTSSDEEDKEEGKDNVVEEEDAEEHPLLVV